VDRTSSRGTGFWSEAWVGFPGAPWGDRPFVGFGREAPPVAPTAGKPSTGGQVFWLDSGVADRWGGRGGRNPHRGTGLWLGAVGRPSQAAGRRGEGWTEPRPGGQAFGRGPIGGQVFRRIREGGPTRGADGRGSPQGDRSWVGCGRSPPGRRPPGREGEPAQGDRSLAGWGRATLPGRRPPGGGVDRTSPRGTGFWSEAWVGFPWAP
jgi:hypothetical protein